MNFDTFWINWLLSFCHSLKISDSIVQWCWYDMHFIHVKVATVCTNVATVVTKRWGETNEENEQRATVTGYRTLSIQLNFCNPNIH